MIKDSGERKYHKHYPGEVIANGGVLIKRITPQKWEIQCACGNTFVRQVAGSSGRCAECARKVASQKISKHNEAPGKNKNASRLYGIWLGMLTRCNNPNYHSYKDYGGRGIKVCDEWSDYITFREWALSNGYQDNLSINRINNDGDYSADNCNWVSKKEQMRNTRSNHLITYQGETMTLAEASERFDVPYNTLKRRINNYGFSVERALTEPIHRGGNYGN